MTDTQRIAEALEQARCAQVNLANLAKTVPGIEKAPMFQIVKMQIDETVNTLEGREA